MPLREAVFAVCLAVAFAVVAVGVGLYSRPAGVIAAGVFFALFSYLLLAGSDGESEE